MIRGRDYNKSRCDGFPAFTASQWQELEQQLLTYRYIISGIPVPPQLISTVITDPSAFFPLQQSLPFGWGCFEMGYGRKIDPEPGRCRRTDGKKWRCSKEAYPDSKYCERHMHRGKNKSKKTTNSSSSSCSVSSSNDECAINYHPLMPDKTQVQSFHTTNTTPSFYPFMSTQSSSLSTHNCTESTQHSSIAPHWLLDSQSYDQPKKQMRSLDLEADERIMSRFQEFGSNIYQENKEDDTNKLYQNIPLLLK
ncbi:unnamed protein product [Amaranthus hypochondriacus]